MKRYVIVGNGVAAARCIEGIRSRDRAGSVTVVSEEQHAVYCRPLISYYLQGKTDLARMQYRDAGFYDRMDCRVLYGQRAAHIRPEAGEVVLEDGSTMPYDALCLATGSAPFVPPFPGLETVPERFSFMTIDDALALERAIDPSSRVLIVGAGLIGLKCAEGISGRVRSVTVCDLADRVLSSILDTKSASLMQRRLEAHGIAFLLGDSVARFEGNRAEMQSGASVEFDILVLAVGVRANVGLFQEIGGRTGRGILVDEHMRTSADGVFAAGDCSESLDVSSGRSRVLAILPNASLQGFAAGVNMAGGSQAFGQGIPMNSIGFFGLHAMSAGTCEGDLYEKQTDTSLKRLYTQNDRLKGFVLIGCQERAGIYTSMIREQIPLSSVDFELLKQEATTAAFPGAVRRKMFGDVV